MLGIAALVAATACSTSKAPLAEPQAPKPFASLVVECPPVLEEKDSEELGAFTASYELNLSLSRDGNSFPIEGACARRARPVHLPPGSARLEAGYEERVKKKSSVLETRVNCDLPTLSQEWAAGKTYVYRVIVAKRDPRGLFNSCSVRLTEARLDGAGPTTARSTSSPAPSP